MGGELARQNSACLVEGSADECPRAAKFRSPQHEAIFNILRTGTHLKDFLSRSLLPFGLTFEQYNILRIVRGAGEVGIAVHLIRARMTTRVPAMTRMLDKMEAKGLLARRRDTPDRRQIMCRLTESGRGLLNELDARLDAADVAAMQGLPEEEVRSLIGLLKKVRGECESMAAHLRTTQI